MTPETDIEDLKPCVTMYCSINLRDLVPLKTYYWCSCGLAKGAWCDDSCKETNYKPLKWVCPEKKVSLYSICGCRYSKAAPLCDTEHIALPLKYLKQIKDCQVDHAAIQLICEKCGFRPK